MNDRLTCHADILSCATRGNASAPVRTVGRDMQIDYCSLSRRQMNVARRQTQRAATVGVAEDGNSAVLVTVAAGAELLDRRRIDLTDRGLPTHPHHHEGSWAVGRYLNIPGARALSVAEAVALVERVRASAARGAREGLEALAERGRRERWRPRRPLRPQSKSSGDPWAALQPV